MTDEKDAIPGPGGEPRPEESPEQAPPEDAGLDADAPSPAAPRKASGGLDLATISDANRSLSDALALTRSPIYEEYRKVTVLEKMMRDAGLGSIGKFGAGFDSGVVGKLAAGLDTGALGKFAKGFDSSIVGKIAAGLPTGLTRDMMDRNSSLARAIEFATGSGAASRIATVHGDYGLKTSAIAESVRSIQTMSRADHWSNRLTKYQGTEIASIMAGSTARRSEIDRILGIAGNFHGTPDMARATAAFSASTGMAAQIEATSLKMALYGGAIDTFGSRYPAVPAAMKSLLGGWETRPDLPEEFWENATLRKRMYREAEVDDGLIKINNSVALEILVDSGAVDGRITPTGVTAVIRVGTKTLAISSRRPRLEMFEAIDGFEVSLRDFVEHKLREAVAAEGEDPERWFVLKAPHLVDNAKKARRAAMRNREAHQRLINFVYLSDLAGIMTGDNWIGIFERVFRDRDALIVDLKRLNASRRPTAHARTMEPTRLVEAILTIRNLEDTIDRDGVWDVGWDDDQ